LAREVDLELLRLLRLVWKLDHRLWLHFVWFAAIAITVIENRRRFFVGEIDDRFGGTCADHRIAVDLLTHVHERTSPVGEPLPGHSKTGAEELRNNSERNVEDHEQRKESSDDYEEPRTWRRGECLQWLGDHCANEAASIAKLIGWRIKRPWAPGEVGHRGPAEREQNEAESNAHVPLDPLGSQQRGAPPHEHDRDEVLEESYGQPDGVAEATTDRTGEVPDDSQEADGSQREQHEGRNVASTLGDGERRR